LPQSGSAAAAIRIFHRVWNISLSFFPFASKAGMACLTRDFLWERIWWRSAQRAAEALFCSSLSSLKKKKHTVACRDSWDLTLQSSSSTRNRDSTDFPHPGSADTHKSLDSCPCRQCRYCSCHKNHARVPGSRFGFRVRWDSYSDVRKHCKHSVSCGVRARVNLSHYPGETWLVALRTYERLRDRNP
jgi:hypothetical protein